MNPAFIVGSIVGVIILGITAVFTRMHIKHLENRAREYEFETKRFQRMHDEIENLLKKGWVLDSMHHPGWNVQPCLTAPDEKVSRSLSDAKERQQMLDNHRRLNVPLIEMELPIEKWRS